MILRDALPADVGVIHDLIRQLAAYENEPDAVRMTPAELHEALFGPKPRAEAVLAVEAAEPLGFAIWFESFNTWTGKPGLYVEDVFVTPRARGRASARPCSPIWRNWLSNAAASGWNGWCWTGTPPPLAFTRSLARRRFPTGRSTG